MVGLSNGKKHFLKVSLVVILLLLICLAIIELSIYSEIEDTFSRTLIIYGPWAIFFLAFILDFIPVFISPIVILLTGIFLGINVHVAVFSAVLGSMFGSIVGYTLGRVFMNKAIYYLAPGNRPDKLTRMVNRYGKVVIPLAAISPLPYMAVVIGAVNVSTRNFLLYGLIPRAAGLALYGYLAGFF